MFQLYTRRSLAARNEYDRQVILSNATNINKTIREIDSISMRKLLSIFH